MNTSTAQTGGLQTHSVGPAYPLVSVVQAKVIMGRIRDTWELLDIRTGKSITGIPSRALLDEAANKYIKLGYRILSDMVWTIEMGSEFRRIADRTCAMSPAFAMPYGKGAK